MHHQRRVGGGGDAARREQHDRQPTITRDQFDKLVRRAKLLGFAHDLVVAQGAQTADVRGDGADVSHRFDHVAGASFTLGTNHRGAFADAPQGLTQIARAAHEWNLEDVLVHVVLFVGRGEYF